MKDIVDLDIQGYCRNAVGEVFETMLSMSAEFIAGSKQEELHGERVVGSVGFAGRAMGNISIYMTADFARTATAAMLGMERDEIEGEEEVHDVVGELSNMVGGSLKSRFCDDGLECKLTIPSITSGNDFRIKCRDLTRHECYGFRCEEHTVFVEVCLKTAAAADLEC